MLGFIIIIAIVTPALSWIVFSDKELNESSNNSDITLLPLRYLTEALLHLQLNDNQLTLRDIVEESNVTFWCEICTSTPSNDTGFTAFFHNGTRMISDEEEGITIDGRYLKMARINKTTAGNYTCETYDRVRRLTSDVWNLVVYDKPDDKVTAEAPAHRRVKRDSAAIRETDNFFLRCDIPDADITSYENIRWFRDEQEIMELDHGVERLVYPAGLILTNITKTAAGVYYCSDGNKTGEKRDISVADAPFDAKERTTPLVITEIETDPKKITVHDTVIFKCHFHPRELKLSRQIFWFKGDDQILYDTKNAIRGALFAIKNVNKTDMGQYRCGFGDVGTTIKRGEAVQLKTIKELAKNFSCNETKPLQVQVRIELQNDEDVHENQNVYFYCDVNSTHESNYPLLWYKNEKRLSPPGINQLYSDDPMEMAMEFRVLILYFATNKTVDQYACSFRINGSEYKNTLFIRSIKNARPTDVRSRYNGQPQAVTEITMNSPDIEDIRLNDDIILICRVEPRTVRVLAVKWLRNDLTVQENLESGIIMKNNRMYLYSVHKNSEGVYSCEAETKRGVVYGQPIQIKIKDSY